MKYTYKAKATSICPNNKALIDDYKVTIETDKMLMVEDIIGYLKKYEDEEIYQEDLTREIAEELPNSKITLIGTHLGVEITSTEYCDD